MVAIGSANQPGCYGQLGKRARNGIWSSRSGNLKSWVVNAICNFCKVFILFISWTSNEHGLAEIRGL